MSIIAQNSESKILELKAILEGLLDALQRERLALAHMNVTELVSVIEEKQVFSEKLADIPSEYFEPQRELRNLAIRVRAHAHANAALLRDAATATAETLGLQTGVGTYDRRARRTMPRNHIAGRTV